MTARFTRARAVLCVGVVGLMGLSGACTTDDGAQNDKSQGQRELVTRLEVPAVAVRHVEAPGFNIDDLTARLRDAVDETSGAPCVHEGAVRAELAACTEAPCPDTVARQYTSALYVIDGSVSRVGESLLATVRVQRGVEELARATASAADARVAITQAGAEVGTKLRRVLLLAGASPLPAPDAVAPGEPDGTAARPDTERGD